MNIQQVINAAKILLKNGRYNFVYVYFQNNIFKRLLNENVLNNSGHGIYYPVYGMVNVKYPLLLFRKSRGSSGLFLSLSEWSFTYPTCNRK